MEKQVKMYCVKLNLVRTKEEKLLGDKRYNIEQSMYKFKKNLSIYTKKKLDVDSWTKECSLMFKNKLQDNRYYKEFERELKQVKKEIHNLYLQNKDLDRKVLSSNIKTKNIIAIGSNNLVRTMQLDLGTFTDKIITVKVGDMDNIITDRIIKNGLDIITKKIVDNKLEITKQHYKFFTAGAGQTRQKKFMMLLDDADFKNIMLNLMCGLTIEDINAKGSLNISKFLAYLSLNNSGSKVWEGFNIDKCIVVEDFETLVNAKVDFIARDTNKIEYKDKLGRKRTKDVAEWTVNKGKIMDVPVPHFDGLGIMLPSLCKKNRQIRLPWLKGLLTPMDYVSYNKINGYSNVVTDIYGDSHDVVKEGTQVIFTKSQFKLWNFYKNWDEYKANFKKHNCTANICMEDEDKYKDMQINYQMLQQLVNMEDKHINILTKDFKELLNKVHSDRQSQLNFLGATEDNEHRNYFQEALRLYPEMLHSAYVKQQIKDTVTKAKKNVCSGKIKIKDSRRVFILSDPTAFCDWLFGNVKVPEGYLQDGEVYCNLYKDSTKLDILRSPSLSFEHAIRNNVRTTKDKYKWFITDGLYTSTKDVLTKILQNDVDGDEALTLSTDWIIQLAEDMIKTYNINPIYYEMGKAGAKEINADNISKSLMFIYEKSNIGKVSNTLSKMWNGENPMENYEIMQKLCAYNNDIIDSAKTLSIPKLPEDVKEFIKNDKYPYFFQYAKKKKELQCKTISNSVMDRICKDIEGLGNIDFSHDKGFGTFRIKTLINQQDNIEVNNDVVKYYLELEKETVNKIDDYVKEFVNDNEEDMKKTNFKEIFYREAREKFINYVKDMNVNYSDAVDSIIKYTYQKNDLKMSFIWNVFGALIINNINKNINKPLDNGYIMCSDCGKRIKRESNRQTKCKKCAIEATKERNKNRNTHLEKVV